MEARRQRTIRSGLEYEPLFPKATADTHTIMKDAGVGDTVAFIRKIVPRTIGQTKKIAKVLKGGSDYDSCRNIWQFVYNHIAYKRDRDGYEQIRSPARSWHDRRSGVDCDCYSTFISSILCNLGIAHKLRITKYNKPFFQHIYPVVVKNGREIILDCVTDKFDFEVPYSEKKDYPMDLQYLNGLDNIDYKNNQLFDGSDEMGELGKLFKNKASNSSGGNNNKGGGLFKKIGGAVKNVTKTVTKTVSNTAKKVGTSAKKVGTAVAKTAKKVELKKVLNVVNKVNPVTLALRNGLLAGMKLNVGNVAKRIRWAYLTADQAKAKGLQMDRWNKLVQVKQKLESIFYGAGGNPTNLRNAIISGKGNSDKAVNGFDGFGRLMDHCEVNRMNIHTPLVQLLGPEVYFSENSMQTLGELGEPVTLATVAAASGAIATIAGLIKKIGDVFGGKGEGAKDFADEANVQAEKELPAIAQEAANAGINTAETAIPAPAPVEPTTSVSSSSYSSGSSANSQASNDAGSSAESPGTNYQDGGGSSSEIAVATTSAGSSEVAESGGGAASSKSAPKTDKPAGNFWESNKKWLLPVGISIGGLTIIAIAAKAMKPSAPSSTGPMHGIPRSRKNHKRKKPKAKGKSKRGNKKAVALL